MFLKESYPNTTHKLLKLLIPFFEHVSMFKNGVYTEKCSSCNGSGVDSDWLESIFEVYGDQIEDDFEYNTDEDVENLASRLGIERFSEEHKYCRICDGEGVVETKTNKNKSGVLDRQYDLFAKKVVEIIPSLSNLFESYKDTYKYRKGIEIIDKKDEVINAINDYISNNEDSPNYRVFDNIQATIEDVYDKMDKSNFNEELIKLLTGKESICELVGYYLEAFNLNTKYILIGTLDPATKLVNFLITDKNNIEFKEEIKHPLNKITNALSNIVNKSEFSEFVIKVDFDENEIISVESKIIPIKIHTTLSDTLVNLFKGL